MTKLSSKADVVKAVSIAVDLNEKIARRLRVDSALNDISPQDQLRKIIGLPYKKVQRPRITLSLRTDDYHYLAKRYNLSPDDRHAIKKAVMEEISKILH